MRLLAALFAGSTVFSLAALEVKDSGVSGHGVFIRLGAETGVLACGHEITTESPRIVEESIALPPASPPRFLPNRDLVFLPLNLETEPAVPAAPLVGEEITDGRATGKILDVREQDLIVDLPFRPGDSGRPLFNRRGEVVGICRALHAPPPGEGKVAYQALRIDRLNPADFIAVPSDVPLDTAIYHEMRKLNAGKYTAEAFFYMVCRTFPTSGEQRELLDAERRTWCRNLALHRISPDPRWRLLRASTFPADRFDDLAADLEKRYGKAVYRAEPRAGSDYRALLFQRAFLSIVPGGNLYCAEYE